MSEPKKGRNVVLCGGAMHAPVSRARNRTALLVNPPVYDTQYWAEWSQPYGLLRIASYLKQQRGYKRVELFDFMQTDERRRVPQQRINPGEDYAELDSRHGRSIPLVISKNDSTIELYKHHYGRSWPEFEAWLDERFERPPQEVWISAVMTYWWESVRDLTLRLKRRWGNKTTIILGGIYPTLCPQHAAEMTAADIIVTGEIPEANDLWTDLSLYEQSPEYAVITPSRGCRFNCAYCAQRALNGGRCKVRHRTAVDVVDEMKDKYDTHGIRDFAFYADALLDRPQSNFQRVLELVVEKDLPFRLHAPEGMDVGVLAKSPRLAELLKATRFQKVYLPVERLDEGYLRALDRKHAHIEDVPRAVENLVRAGFKPRNMDINAFVLYGLPQERIADVVKTILWVSETVGSIIPMLFTPVPTTKLFKDYLPWFRERGWDMDLHMLNGKLFPFLELSDGSAADYVDLQRLMYTLNAHYRDESFRVFGQTRVSEAFRCAITDDQWFPAGPDGSG